jgi:Putative transposase of IS4/5 family (DUF4096)
MERKKTVREWVAGALRSNDAVLPTRLVHTRSFLPAAARHHDSVSPPNEIETASALEELGWRPMRSLAPGPGRRCQVYWAPPRSRIGFRLKRKPEAALVDARHTSEPGPPVPLSAFARPWRLKPFEGLFFLSDAEWRRVKPLLPPQPPFKKRADDRRTISGVIHKLRSGGTWADGPPAYGSPKTLARRFAQWGHAGLWSRIFAVLDDGAALYEEPVDVTEFLALEDDDYNEPVDVGELMALAE